ncbi:MAG: choice-of-anchor D domain-containing protein [Bacteroidetes bacterium]|nr:choice-of-anchor D domain-containing protein [Bacteroidota bacterium]
MKHLLLFIALCAVPLTAQTVSVTPVGPDGGMVTLLRGSLNDEVVIAVLGDGEVYRSTNGGSSWLPVSLDVPGADSCRIRAIVVHPVNPDTILMASSLGLLRSSNRGATFTLSTQFPSPSFSIIYSPANPAVLFGSDINGPLQSTDGGAVWKPIKDGTYFGNRTIVRMAVHPSDTGSGIRLLAVASQQDEYGIYFSPNTGKTWRPFVKSLPGGGARSIYSVSIDSIGIGRTHFRTVIGTAQGIYGAQTDYNDTAWVPITANNNAPSGVVTDGVLVYDKFDLTALQDDRHKFALYYVSNASEFNGNPKPFTEKSGLFKIGSKFNSLFTVSLFEPPPVKRVFNRPSDISSVFIPSSKDKSKIYIGTSGGIYISTDDGLTWERRNNGIGQAEVRNIVSLPSLTGTPLLFAGVFGAGVLRSSDGGATWNEANIGLSSPYVLSLTADPKENLLYAGTALSVYRSVDRGVTWTQLFAVDSSVIRHPTKYTNREHEITVRYSPAKSTNVLFNSQAFGLYLSTNGGGTWNRLPSPFADDSSLIPESIEFDPNDPFTIYHVGPSVFRSTNGGQAWTDITSNLPRTAFNPATASVDGLISLSPAINPMQSNELLLPTVFANGDGVPYRTFRSTNAGASWDTASSTMTAYDAVYDRFDAKRIVASGPGGIYRSLDGGISWSRLPASQTNERYFLLSPHHADPNIYFAGSGHGGHRIVFNELPKLTADTGVVEFGSIKLGSDSLRTVRLSNVAGSRNVIVTVQSISDSAVFRYNGPKTISIPAGAVESLPILFQPSGIGLRTAVLRITSTDPALPLIQIGLRGHAYDRFPFDEKVIAFGPVTVGKDSVVTIDVPNQSTTDLTVTLSAIAEPLHFSMAGTMPRTIPAGSTGTLSFRYHPKSIGEHRSAVVFTTNDLRFPAVSFLLHGSGVQRAHFARTVVLDTTYGGMIEGYEPLGEYYRLLSAALQRAGFSVRLQSLKNTAGVHSVVLTQPSRPMNDAVKDSLMRFVSDGGTLVLLADHRDSGAYVFNQFLSDPSWRERVGTVPGFVFSGSLLIDSLATGPAMEGRVTSVARVKNAYTAGAEHIAFRHGTYLTIDTTILNAGVLYRPSSQSLYSVTGAGIITPVPAGIGTVVHSSLGKGRIIALSATDIWWNGDSKDTNHVDGLSAAGNLRLALNIFGSVENIIAEVREMIEERYELISIPYTFADSSISALFKDLGAHNTYLWRMFGRYTPAQGYKEFPTDFSRVRRGEGYWLISKEKKSIKLGNAQWQGVAEDFEILVPPGFSMIGNPFPYAVSWANSFREDSVHKVLWEYADGKYDTTTSAMEPFKGYWVFNRSTTPKQIRINALPVTVPVLQKQEGERLDLPAGDWKAQVTLVSRSGRDAVNYIGVLSSAHDGWDDEDFVKPPSSPGSGSSIAVSNHGMRLSADYRAFHAQGNVWEVMVSGSSSEGTVSISVALSGSLPEGFGLYVLDPVTERIYDVRTVTAVDITFSRGETSRPLRFIAGDARFVQEQSNGVPLVPLEYALSQNFPNPFNPVTTIIYSLAHSSDVKLEIFNILGQKVRTLVDAPRSIGVYSVQWDGKDNHGILLSSGIYYYQIQTKGFRAARMMTFVK